MLLRIIFIFLFLCNTAIANITDELIKLSELYKQGLLTEIEFKKAKSILLEINEITKQETKLKIKPKTKEKKKLQKVTKKTQDTFANESDIKIERIFTTEGSKYTTKNFEKMKLIVGDFQIYTHRPGAIKVKKISNNKQLAVIGDKLQFKYYNKGQNSIKIDLDKDKNKLDLFINDIKVLIWKGQYVQQAEATFYQILAMGREPFHYYIKLKNASTAVAINMENFTRKIELAVDRVKLKLSQQYNLSIEQINQIIDENDMMAANKFIKTDDVLLEKELSKKKNKLYSDLEASLGSDKFNTIKSGATEIIDQTLEGTITKEIKVAVDDSIRDAINSGIEAAALEAGLTALIEALLSGASWADALAAGEAACASSGGC